MKRLSTQKGSIMVFSIFGIFFLIGVMALVVNAGFLISNKVQMQNAVDSSSYSGAVVQARGLNVLSALNQNLQQAGRTYQGLLVLWGAAVALDQGKPEGPAQKSWRFLYERKLRSLCDRSALQKIRCAQSRIVSRFNSSYQDGLCPGGLTRLSKNVVVDEAGKVGRENLSPLAYLETDTGDFSSWAMNFHQGGKMPGLSVEIKPETARHFTGAGANSLSKGITCDIPPQWGLKADFERTQYVLSAVTSTENRALFWPSYFGSGDKSYAISKGKPARPGGYRLELLSTEWEGQLVPVNTNDEDEEIFQRFRKSSEGKTLGFQQAPTRPLLH